MPQRPRVRLVLMLPLAALLLLAAGSAQAESWVPEMGPSCSCNDDCKTFNLHKCIGGTCYHESYTSAPGTPCTDGGVLDAGPPDVGVTHDNGVPQMDGGVSADGATPEDLSIKIDDGLPPSDPPDDDGGCSVSQGAGHGSGAPLALLLPLALLPLVRRRR